MSDALFFALSRPSRVFGVRVKSLRAKKDQRPTRKSTFGKDCVQKLSLVAAMSDPMPHYSFGIEVLGSA